MWENGFNIMADTTSTPVPSGNTQAPAPGEIYTTPPILTDDASAAPPELAPLKPGLQTTETWLAFFAQVFGALIATGAVGSATELGRAVAMLSIALTAVVQSLSRTSLKKAHLAAVARVSSSRTLATWRPAPAPAPSAVLVAKTPQGGFARLPLIIGLAILTIGSSVFVSCASLQKMTGAYASCAKTDFNEAIDPSKDPALAGLTAADLLAFVEEIITLNADKLEAQLAAVAAIVGIDALECAVVALEDVFNAPTATSVAVQATPEATALKAARATALGRARAWISSQHASGRKK